MGKINDFISSEPRTFRFRLGRALASSLSGFVAGVLAASIVWVVAIIIFKLLS
jgi:hypothetical protein